MVKHAFVTETLTASEVAAVFTIADPDGEPLPRPTRALIVWQGAEWAEIDPETGAILCRGNTDALSGRLPRKGTSKWSDEGEPESATQRDLQ